MRSTKHDLPQMSDWLSTASPNSYMMNFVCHRGTWLIEMSKAGSNGSSFSSKQNHSLKIFWDPTKGSGNRWGSQAVLSLLHQIGDVLVRRVKETKCYMPAFPRSKSALCSDSVGNSTGVSSSQ